jgi:hypothetical protein
MNTPISIVSLNQGKGIYKDWTLEVVDDTPKPSIFVKLAALWSRLQKLSAASGAGVNTQTMVPGE